MNYIKREEAIREIMNNYGKVADLRFIETINPRKVLVVDGDTIIAENKDFHEAAKDQIGLFEWGDKMSGKYQLNEFEEGIYYGLKDILEQVK